MMRATRTWRAAYGPLRTWWSRKMRKPMSSPVSLRYGIPGLSLSALSEAGLRADNEAVKPATDWLFDKQVFTRGDWTCNDPDLEGGGWAFQFENDLYPDVDDTSMVVMALLRAGAHYHPDKKRAHRPGRQLDYRHAEHRWRLGRLRYRQPLRIPERHSVRRPWGAGRPQQRGT